MKYIVLILLFASCNIEVQKSPKPYIIVGRDYVRQDKEKGTVYTYEDSIGYERTFVDENDAYKIGDTIK